jgi:hypothetical protein
MFVVKRCVRDFDEIWRIAEAEFDTQAEAETYVDEADRSDQFDVWHEIDEE